MVVLLIGARGMTTTVLHAPGLPKRRLIGLNPGFRGS